MAGSRKPGPTGDVGTGSVLPAQTPGTLGLNDQADPSVMALCGDSPGPVGRNDYAEFSTIESFGWSATDLTGEILVAQATGTPQATTPTAAKPKFPASISQAGISLIESFEGFRTKMYNDVAHNCTIGYGQLIHKGPCTGKNPAEKPYLKGISQPQAEELLKQKVQTFEATIKAYVKVDLNQNQFDALVSFVYNVGPGAFQSSTLLANLNKGLYASVPGEMMKWVYAGGVVQPGLANRRKKEAELFSQP